MLEIRRYRSNDREGVRSICVQTAFLGNSILPQYSDFESLADMFTGYYTDNEPESAWVVVDGERVVGYLLGCLDSRNSPAPEWVVFKHIMRRWLWLRRGTAGFCFRSLFDVLRDFGPARPKVDFNRWPAHSHLDLLPEARKGAIAMRLFRLWLDLARDRGAPGVWGASIVENHPSTLFHKAMGFRTWGDPFSAAGLRTADGKPMQAQIWLRDLMPALPREVPVSVPVPVPVAATSASAPAPAREA